MMTKKKPAKMVAKKPALYRRGVVKIDYWNEVSEHILGIAAMMSRCEHDQKPLTDLFSKLYVCGFSHGLANGLLRGRRPKARKVKYASRDDQPQTLVAKCVRKFLDEMEMVHAISSDHPPIPVSHNN